MIEWQLVCDALKFCSPAGEVPTAEPTVFVPPTPACAGVDDRAQDCGAANTARPQSCCAGLVCGEGASVRCVEPTAGAPTATPTEDLADVPTASVTVEPSMSGGTPEPTTEAPATSEPTMGDTDAPTDDATTAPEPTLPPSSASKMAAVTAAIAVIVAAPLLL